ncbi:hypothetical protein MASR2M39_19990 [Ignavibacteriales bacterium]
MDTGINQIKINERTFAGHIIGWLQMAIREGKTVFQDATNDSGVKLESGRTKFPDILLFSNKTSGIVFNGWELKFPDTRIDDISLLENALEKAKRLNSNSFVTWNGRDAVIWEIIDGQYSINQLKKLKIYPSILSISSREDMANPNQYLKNEPVLQNRLFEILHDLESFMFSGKLKPAINICDHFISAIMDSSSLLIPQFETSIKELIGFDLEFRREFNKWKILERGTIKILSSSSSKVENITEEEILAKFVFYNLVCKLVFYYTLSHNLSGKLNRIEINDTIEFKSRLWQYFDDASAIDYSAVFRPYFTDKIEFNNVTSDILLKLLRIFDTFDFRVLPVEVIGSILEGLIPPSEKKKFGQYFTNPTLADLVAFPAINSNNDLIFDPTCGTGTFLESFYHILQYLGVSAHSKLLHQIWGNDISHFPATLSVINLYKQDIRGVENFPRVLRGDLFDLLPGSSISFPDPINSNSLKNEVIPKFDAIISNFPFIQQEDIPNELLSYQFHTIFKETQKAFLSKGNFRLNERSDYFTYCIYKSIGFLKNGGRISAITSNAWLGKEYGIQFKEFLLDNFQIKYIIRSNAEHWFQDSQVSSVFILLEFSKIEIATKFITINKKLDELFYIPRKGTRLDIISNFYTELDNYNNPDLNCWLNTKDDDSFLQKKDNSVSFRIVSRDKLVASLEKGENWESFFSAFMMNDTFKTKMVQANKKIYHVFRGERTGWNPMYIIRADEIDASKIDQKYLLPYIKSSTELEHLKSGTEFSYYLFSCVDPTSELQKTGQGTLSWIDKFKNEMNKNGLKTIEEASSTHTPFWYSLSPKKAQIVTAINPYERLFFSFMETPCAIDQRLIGFNVVDGYDSIYIAALLNSVITLIQIEKRGTSRHQGVLDLNANYFKELMLLNPDLPSDRKKKRIIEKFNKLCQREVLTIQEEFKMKDRLAFEKTIFEAYNIPIGYINQLYTELTAAVKERVTLKTK